MLTSRPIGSRPGSAAAAGAAVVLLAGAGLLTAAPTQADPRPCPGAGPGDPDADGHGFRYWMQVSTGSASGYVNDWYLDSGGPGTWKPQIPQC